MPITVTGLTEARTSIRNVVDNFNTEVKDTLEIIGEEVVQEIKQRTPIDTGRLWRSIGYRIEVTTRGFKLIFGSILSHVPYAPIVEYGEGVRLGVFYLRNAWEAKRAWAVDQIKDATKRAAKI